MKRFISIALAVVLVFALAACSGGSKAEPVDFTGTYDIIRIEAGEESISEEDIALLNDLGYEAILSFADDGTGLMSIAGEETEFTYDNEASTITIYGTTSDLYFNEEGQLVVEDGEASAMYMVKRAE